MEPRPPPDAARRRGPTVRAHRRLDDATVRRLQLRGSARLNAYVRRAVTHGLQAANLGGAQRGRRAVPPTSADGASTSDRARAPPDR